MTVVTELIAFLIFEALWFVPYSLAFKAAGIRGHYAYLALLPILGPLICTWILAYHVRPPKP
ncbi:hypothetical protein P3W85_23050 [Cupriavidus basilensis]|uniref:Uncharacterized protein n=1 Tax=Cupriavidus basilensis TaxID=68895 RepID=A0ABT6AT47_9BURK|nr:hypothetical protein [Cupriavidus basilensis]MDF3835805.1 hypothetical protein [Cupriavidus basilensis]